MCAVYIDVKSPLNALQPVPKEAESYEVGYCEDVYKQKKEVFAVPKANTVINPRTMVIHVENTTITNRAMMASLWFENVTHETVTTTFLFWVAQVEAPKHWHLTWVSGHGLYEGPDK